MGNGARTHDTRNHNPVLCQLSYTHHMELSADRAIRNAVPVKPPETGPPRSRPLASWGEEKQRNERTFGEAGSEGYGVYFDDVARLKGLEPLTHCLEGSCSIHLSYRRI